MKEQLKQELEAAKKKVAELDFGDYCTIEQHRYGCDNEHYTHKVIGRLRSNYWVDVPVMHNATETYHDHMEDVVACVCCGVSEREILKYRLSDVRKQELKAGTSRQSSFNLWATDDLIDCLPQNRPLYKDSGLWQIRNDDMGNIYMQQNCNETLRGFIIRYLEWLEEHEDITEVIIDLSLRDMQPNPLNNI